VWQYRRIPKNEKALLPNKSGSKALSPAIFFA